MQQVRNEKEVLQVYCFKKYFLFFKNIFYMIVLQKIKHPFLISLSDVWKDNHNLYFLFPFHCGGELFTFMRMYDR